MLLPVDQTDTRGINDDPVPEIKSVTTLEMCERKSIQQERKARRPLEVTPRVRRIGNERIRKTSCDQGKFSQVAPGKDD